MPTLFRAFLSITNYHSSNRTGPWCFTAGGTGPSAGKQLAWNPSNDPFGDTWCQKVTNNEPPRATVPAHVSPLSMTFLGDANGCGTDAHSFPCEMKGDMFLALHGSVTNDVPKGGFPALLEANVGCVTFRDAYGCCFDPRVQVTASSASPSRTPHHNNPPSKPSSKLTTSSIYAKMKGHLKLFQNAFVQLVLPLTIAVVYLSVQTPLMKFTWFILVVRTVLRQEAQGRREGWELGVLLGLWWW